MKMTMLSPYDSWQPFVTIAATTTRAKIDVAAVGTSCRAVMITLDGTADKQCLIGDVTVTAAGGGKVHTCLTAGGSVTVPVADTFFNAGVSAYVVMGTSSAGANVYVSLLK